jgi:hypothetical protein
LNNQKRQMIGQTAAHVLVTFLKARPVADRAHLAATLRQLDASDPGWLKKLINAHVAHTRYFWRLFPGILGFRWRRLGQMRGCQKVTHFPAAAAGFAVALIACWQAARFLRAGAYNYWPKTGRQTVSVEPILGAK